MFLLQVRGKEEGQKTKRGGAGARSGCFGTGARHHRSRFCPRPLLAGFPCLCFWSSPLPGLVGKRHFKKMFPPKVYFIFIRERNRERDRGKLLSCLLHVPQPGMEPTTQAGAPTRDQTCDLLVVGQRSSQLRHTGQGGKKPLFSPSLLRSIPVGRRGRAGTRAAMSWLLSCA